MKTLLLPLIFASIGLQAQSNFVRGLVIEKSGDTLTGFIDNRYWKQNPNVIKYHGDAGAVREFIPIDIDGFYLPETKEWYKTAIVSVDKSSTREGDIVKNVNMRGVQVDTVFLRVLVRGRLSLYHLLDENARGHYVAEKNGQLKELWIEKKRILDQLDGIVTIEHYKAQLRDYAADCSNPPGTSEVKYGHKPLAEFVTAYNKCFPTSQEYTAPVNKIESAFSALVGVTTSGLIVSNGFAEASYESGVTLVGGLSYEAIFPGNRKAFSFYCELIYRAYNMEEVYKASQLKLATMARYSLPVKGKLKPFVGVGITNALAVGPTLPTEESGRFRKYEQGLAGDVGVSIGKLGALARFESSNGFSPNSGLSTNFKTWYVCAWYRFN